MICSVWLKFCIWLKPWFSPWLLNCCSYPCPWFPWLMPHWKLFPYECWYCWPTNWLLCCCHCWLLKLGFWTWSVMLLTLLVVFSLRQKLIFSISDIVKLKLVFTKNIQNPKKWQNFFKNKQSNIKISIPKYQKNLYINKFT